MHQAIPSTETESLGAIFSFIKEMLRLYRQQSLHQGGFVKQKLEC